MSNLQTDINSLTQNLKNGEKYAIINKISTSVKQKLYKDEEIQNFLKTDIVKVDKFTKILYVNIANHIQNNETFIKLLKTEDDQIISDVLRKFTYFYIQKIHTPEYYSTEIFPIISYTHRLLLIKVLAENFENVKAEIFFDKLYKIYGLKTAKSFLKKCSQNFILEKLNHPGIVLQTFELKSFLPKHPKFVLEYLTNLIRAIHDKKKMITKIDFSKYKKIMKELLIYFPREIMELLSNGSDMEENKFGKRMTKRCLKNTETKDIIMKKPEHFDNMLTKSSIFKVLTKEEYIEFIKDFHPSEVDSFDYEINCKVKEYLDFYKSDEDKLNLLLKSYKSRYDKEWLDNPRHLSPSIMKLLDKERRLKFANEKILNNDENYLKIEKWKCYLDCATCIPMFKEQIKLASDLKDRIKYMKYIIESCIINDDMEQLHKFLKYFNERHRNEMSSVRTSIINYMGSYLKLERLTEEIWNEINLIWDIVELNDEYHRMYGIQTFVEDSIKYTINNNKLLEKAIKNYIIIYRSIFYYYGFITLKNKVYDKKFLELIGKLFPETIVDKSDFASFTFSYLKRLITWNMENPNDMFSILDYPWLVGEITKIFDTDDDNEKERHYNLVKKDIRASEHFNKQIADYRMQFHLKNLEILAKENPEVVKNNIDVILENIKSVYTCRYHIIPALKSGALKNIEGVEERIRNFCWNTINSNTEEDWSIKGCVFHVLSHWLTAEEYLKIARDNYPKTSCAPIGTPMDKHIFELHTAIAFKIKDYKNHPDIFEVLRKFCVGDYLKLSIGSLNSLCVKAPFNKSIEFLNSCIESPVSFQKHVIRLKCCIDKRNENLKLLKELWLKATNASIRKVIFENIFNIFVSAPDTNLWQVVKVSIESLNSKDKYTLDTLLNFDQIPDEYLSEFTELCWLTIDKMAKESPDLIEKKFSILNVINKNIMIISIEFIESILNDYLFKDDLNNELQYGFNLLAAKYIFNGNDNTIQLKRIDNILNKFKIIYETNWNKFTYSNDQIIFPTRSNINDFLEEIMNISINEKNKTRNLSIFILLNLQNKILLISNATFTLYDGQLQLKITQIYLKSNNFIEFGKNLRNLVNNEILEKGDYVIKLFKTILKRFLVKVNDVKLSDIVNGLLTEPIESNGCALLGLILIKSDVHKKENENIKTLLMKLDNQNIKILLSMF